MDSARTVRKEPSRETYALLIVEDDPVDALTLKRNVCEHGFHDFEVSHVTSVSEARSLLETGSFDLVALDLGLSDASGRESFERIADFSPVLPIIILTGRDDRELALELIRSGAQDYVIKSSGSDPNVVRCFEFAIARHRIERELFEARERAEHASQAKSVFLASMSHEIRTPLNAIMGTTDLLLDSPLNSDQQEYVHMFQRCSRSLLGLINNVLEVSRIEEGNIEIEDLELDLREILEECAGMFGYSAHEKGLGIAVAIDPELPNLLRGDPGRLRQILINLIGNALKFTQEGEVIASARAERSDAREELVIEVRDTGPGVPEETRPVLFERFAQGHPNTAGRAGSGLGLAISRELARRMDGDLTYSPRDDGGSTFKLHLPLRSNVEDDAAHPSRALAGQRLLVVQVRRDEREALVEMLRNEGARVEAADALDEARQLWTDEPRSALPFDGLIVDVRSAGNGFQPFARKLQSQSPSPRLVVLLPMNHRAGDVGRFESMGAIPVLRPVVRQTLLEALGEQAGSCEEASLQHEGQVTPQLAGRSILLAEDHEDNQMLFKAYLEKTGCDVEVAADGVQAIQAWSEGSFDLVLMDMDMPVLDGKGAAREIRKREKERGLDPTPIVALTAYAFRDQVESCIEAGCDEHLAKPVQQAQLFELLARHLAPDGSTSHSVWDLSDLVPQFLERRTGDLSALRASLAANDLVTIRRVGHNLRGSATCYGFPELATLGADLEDAAEAGHCEEAAKRIDEFASWLEQFSSSGG